MVPRRKLQENACLCGDVLGNVPEVWRPFGQRLMGIGDILEKIQIA